MAILDFPSSPTSGQVYNGPNGASYTWDGAVWVCSSGGAGGGALGTQALYTANATLTTANHDSLINANAGAVQLTLPAFSTALAGQVFRITRVDASTFQATIMPAGADTIDGVNAFITIAPNESASLMACGTVANARQWVRAADPTWRTIQTGNVLTPGDANKVLVSQAAGNAIQWGARTSKARLAAGLVADAADSVTLSLNGGAYPFASNPDNTANASWQTRMRGGASDDWSVLRAPATSGVPAFASLLGLDATGNLTAAGANIVLGGGTAKARMQTASSGVATGSATLMANRDWATNAQDDATKVSWALLLRTDSDNVTLQRAPAGSTTQTSVLTVDSGGNLTITGATATKASGTTWANPSDRRLKKNIEPYVRGLAAILALAPMTFQFNGKAGSQDGLAGIGLIADDVQPVMPEMVSTTSAHLDPEDASPVDVLTLDTTALVMALVNAIKELTARLAALEAGA